MHLKPGEILSVRGLWIRPRARGAASTRSGHASPKYLPPSAPSQRVLKGIGARRRPAIRDTSKIIDTKCHQPSEIALTASFKSSRRADGVAMIGGAPAAGDVWLRRSTFRKHAMRARAVSNQPVRANRHKE
ncbi:hypothetical protein SCHPADRAFT_897556, partial [Schizopora paradoxa]